MKKLLQHPRVRLHLQQVVKFIMCGLLGAVIEFSILYVLVGQYTVTPVIAYIFSGGIPSIFVFFFNRSVTFGAQTGSTQKQTGRFVMVYTFTFFLNYLLASALYLLGVHIVLPLPLVQSYGVTPLDMTYLAKVIAIAITAVINYSFSHFFIFKHDGRRTGVIPVPFVQL